MEAIGVSQRSRCVPRLCWKARKAIDTKITGTVYLIYKVGSEMRQRNSGRILITALIAGFMPGSFQAI